MWHASEDAGYPNGRIGALLDAGHSSWFGTYSYISLGTLSKGPEGYCGYSAGS